MNSWLRMAYRHIFVGMGASSIGFLSLFAGLNWQITTYDQGFAIGLGSVLGLLTALFHTKLPNFLVWMLLLLASIVAFIRVVMVYNLPIFSNLSHTLLSIGAFVIVWLVLFWINRWAFDRDVAQVNRLLNERRKFSEERGRL